MEDKTGSLAGSTTNSARKAVSVAAGEAHTLALSGDGSVYVWGRGMFGRLGTGIEDDEVVPIPIKFETCGGSDGGDQSGVKRLKVVDIAAGAYHSLALADDGSVWCWGYNVYGQLGTDEENCVLPRLLEQFLEQNSSDPSNDESERKTKSVAKVCAVGAGGMMSLAIDNLGILWMWGNCPQNSSDSEEGFSFVSSYVPIPVRDFYGRTVVKVACGNEHVIALVSAGEAYKGEEDLLCYSWGANNHGQLGSGDTKSRARPVIVETFNHDTQWAVYEAACGASHTALLTRKRRPNDAVENACWTFGLGANGQLGHGTTQSTMKPELVEELPLDVFFVSVDCGLFHTTVVASSGDVWSWGMERGLGLCPEASFTREDSGDSISPRHISGVSVHGPKFYDPIKVACGAAHTILIVTSGYELWSWGRGRSGVLGNGKTIDFYSPTAVSWPPFIDSVKEQELNTPTNDDNAHPESSQESAESEKRSSGAMEEMKLLQSKLSTMERYAGFLHSIIYGKPFREQDIPALFQDSASLDMAKEWENMLESADQSKLVRMEMFYRRMRADVKDKILKRRIQEMISVCVPSSNSRK